MSVFISCLIYIFQPLSHHLNPMSSLLDVFSEEMRRASNPINKPPPRLSALDMSSPGAALDPSLATHWQNGNQSTPPNTAIELHTTQWQPPSPHQYHTPISQNQHTWPEESFTKRNHSQSYSEVEAGFHQQATAFDGMTQMHNRVENPSPPRPNCSNSGEPPQSKASAVDDLFSDADDNEMPDFDAMDRDDNMFEMSGLGQQAQDPTQPDLNTSLQTIPSIYQTPYHATIIGQNDFADPVSHPSPTESQLVAEGFEFHNELPEEVQITRFNDKAFRKALREVQSDLPRKQQWYAWSKAKQMLSTEPGSTTTTEHMDKNGGEPLKRQDQNGHEHEIEHERHHEHQPLHERGAEHPQYRTGYQPGDICIPQDGGLPANRAMDRNWRAPGIASSSPASTGGFAVGQGDWHASREGQHHGDWTSKPFQIDQDRLKKHPLGNIISRIADEHKVRRESEAKGIGESVPETHRPLSHHQEASRQNSNTSESAAALVTAKKLAEIRALREQLRRADQLVLAKMKEALMVKMVARRDGSAHGLLSRPDNILADSDVQDNKAAIFPTTTMHPLPPPQASTIANANANASANAPPLPARPVTSHPSTHSADLLRPHTNTIIRRSPSPSSSLPRHIPTPLSPNRRSPSPWIEHPGINRPDTPRPSRPTSPNRSNAASIRQSVERSSPFSDRARDRESTPAYTQRSPSPSPASHLGMSSSTQYMPAARINQEGFHREGFIPHERGGDTIMTDAPSPPPIPGRPPPDYHRTSSPDPLSSPLHAGNTYTAPTTPNSHPHPSTLHHTLLPPVPIPPIPTSSTLSLHPKKTRRKSLGGQTPSSAPKAKRNPTSVQGANIQKSRKVTQVAQKVKATAKKETKTAGSKVAQAVKKIEEGIKGTVGGAGAEGSPPRRSGRLAKKGK
jgi:hypothetical protein